MTLVELPLVLPPAVAGIGLLVAFGRFGLLHTGALPFTQAAVDARGHVRREPALRAPGDRGLRGGRPDPRRRLAHARRRAGADVLPRRAAARRRRPRAPARRSRSRAGSASSARRSCSPAACAAARRRCRSRSTRSSTSNFDDRARDQRAARDRQRRRSSSRSNCVLLATLSVDFTLPLRSFDLELALEVGGTVALVGPSGAGKTTVLRAIAGLRGRARAGSRSATTSGSTRRGGSSCAPDERRVGLVFQEYALFPHMSVRAERRLRRQGARRRAARAVPHRAPRAGAHRRSSRAASASASRSHARSRATRRCCSSTSRSRRSTRTPRRPCARELQRAAARARAADAPRHARLRGRGGARRPGRRDRRRALRQLATPAGARRAAGRRVRRVVHGREHAPRERRAAPATG